MTMTIYSIANFRAVLYIILQIITSSYMHRPWTGTHKLFDKSRVIPVLRSVTLSPKGASYCEPLMAVWLSPSTNEP